MLLRTRGIVLALVGLILLTWAQVFLQAEWARQAAARKTAWGVTFAPQQASWLGQDWRRTFLLLLDDLGVRHFRLSAYWNAVEAEQGTYDFSDLDWMLAEVERRGGTVILGVGRRLPRWPECHNPSWLAALEPAAQREAQLALVRATVERYRRSPAVVAWQVENEPFLGFYGDCPAPDESLVREEIALVHGLDSRPAMVTESGELSTWRHAAALADIVGVSLYRNSYTPGIGTIPYLLVPNVYRMHADLVALITGKPVFITELQMEPWVAQGILSSTIDEMELSMAPEDFGRHARFAAATGLSPIYLWGAEWWLWMKETQDEPAYWDQARELFRGQR